jgi:AraC-like DNA-binding protein
MKKKKSSTPFLPAEGIFKPHDWGRLQKDWIDAVRKSNEIYFELFRRDQYRLKTESPIFVNRQDLFLVFLITGGEGVHQFGSSEHYLKPGILCFVAPGIFTSDQSTINEHAGYLCTFTSAFYGLNLSDKDALSHFSFFETQTSVSLQLNTRQTAYFYNLFQEMEEEYLSANPAKDDMVRALLMLLLLKAKRLVASDKTDCLVDNSNAGIRLTKAFTRLFESDFEPLNNLQAIVIKTLASYAQQLNVTQNHLNDTVKAISGKTPGALIREKIIKEASRLLLNTQLSISEICCLLRFEDPSYFSRFFKRYTGLTPTQHRNRVI